MIQLDFGFGALEGEFWRLVFVMTRIGAALVAAPLFGIATVPPQVRVITAGAVAVMVCAWTDVTPPAALLSLAGMVSVAGEVVIGLALGFVLQMAFAAPVIAAEVMGGAMGMNMAMAIDPTSGAQSPALGQYLMVVVTLIFLALGAHLQWFALVVESYRVFPPGHAWLGAARYALIAGYASQMFVTAVTIALPVCLVLFIVQMVTGVLSRSAPALNLFSLGLPAGVLAGIAALVVSAPVLTDLITRLSADAIAATAGVIAEMSGSDDGEKTFDPTQKRKRDAAQKGDVLRSRELATAAAMMVGAVWMLAAGPWVMNRLMAALQSGFTWDRAAIDDFQPGRLMFDALLTALPPILVLGLAVIAVSLISQLGFGEGRWLGSNLAPKASRIDPAKGFKRIFGPNGLIEIAKGLAKVLLLGTIAWYWANGRIETYAQLGRGDLLGQLSYALARTDYTAVPAVRRSVCDRAGRSAGANVPPPDAPEDDAAGSA